MIFRIEHEGDCLILFAKNISDIPILIEYGVELRTWTIVRRMQKAFFEIND